MLPADACKATRGSSTSLSVMSRTFVLALLISVAAVYLLAAGVSFALMYRIGPRFPSRAAGIVFAPLEWLASRSVLFSRFYNWLCVLCYRVLVGGPLRDGWPPPPRSGGRSQ